MESQLYLKSLQRLAQQEGFFLLEPMADMYGGYECSIQDARQGSIQTVMNCRSRVEAAEQALRLCVKDVPSMMAHGSLQAELEGA